MSRKDDPVFQPIKVGALTAQNRFVINAMECCDSDDEGNPTEKTLRRYTNLFEGGAGIIDLEAITVQYESRSRKYQLSVMPRNQAALTKFTAQLRKVNPKPLFVWQLTHSGELSHTAFSRRVCVKPLPGFGGDVIDEAYVEKTIEQFVTAAKIAHDSGADGIDFKNCHGYFDSQILRPYNDRKWKYGGSFENRTRFTFTIYERIAKEINDPKFIVGSKVSIWEGFPGGQGSAGPDSPVMDISESLALVKGMEARGAKFIIVSVGSPSITLAKSQPDKRVPDDVYLHFTFQKAVRDALKPETVVIGSAYSVLNNGNNQLQARNKDENTLYYWANKNIRDRVTDMVAIGRQSLADGQLPKKLLEEKDKEIKWCTACDNCIEFLIRQQNVGCATFSKEYSQALKAIRQQEGELAAKRT
jgi:2,4-dienoyl-CoA reductase-like NADH-dependent reductase (Old Yellow Enzyme family)